MNNKVPNSLEGSGFTLIELSIVLVIIGLIVGGVLVGQDLIRAAEIRQQISQFERVQSATNTFRGKFNAIPGDISASAATQFGFIATPVRAGTSGMGDGNGELDGASSGVTYSWNQNGENLFFWEDITTNSGLFEGKFNSATNNADLIYCSSTNCNAYVPYGKIGSSNFMYVYSGYASQCCSTSSGIGPNLIGLGIVQAIATSNVSPGGQPPKPGLTVAQAASMDSKIDDGLPTTGNMLAQFLFTSGVPTWSPNSATASSTTCYDTASGTASYSLSVNNGKGVNCGISVQLK